MKVKERAVADFQECIEQVDATPVPMDNWQRNERLVVAMNKKGWSISTATLMDTAKTLGFPVVGVVIYGMDD